MAPVIIIMPLAQNADVEMQLWLVSACCRHTSPNNPVLITRSSSQDVVLQHIPALRTPVFLHACTNMSHPPRAAISSWRRDSSCSLMTLMTSRSCFPQKQTSPLSRKTLMGPWSQAREAGLFLSQPKPGKRDHPADRDEQMEME